MGDTFRCSVGHSRSSKYWKYETDSTGRHHLRANKKGVWARLGNLIRYLEDQGGSLRAGQLEKHLLKGDPSARESDLSQVAKHFKRHNLITIDGRGQNATWTLTAKGRNFANNWGKLAKVEWV